MSTETKYSPSRWVRNNSWRLPSTLPITSMIGPYHQVHATAYRVARSCIANMPGARQHPGRHNRQPTRWPSDRGGLDRQGQRVTYIRPWSTTSGRRAMFSSADLSRRVIPLPKL